MVLEQLTIDFQPDLARAIKLRSQEAGLSVSEYVAEAVRIALREDADDLTAFEEARDEPDRPFSEFVEELRLRGKI